MNRIIKKLSILIVLTSCFSCYSTEGTREQSSVRSDYKLSIPKEARLIPHEFPFKSKQLSKDTIAPVNDPFYTRNWGLKEVNAIQAWQINKGDKRIIVAVIDTGIDVNHEDLKSNLWVNPGETGNDKSGRDKGTNGKDDDGNGLVDDIYGWNFVDNNNNLKDNHGHGTHIAGIISAASDNLKGTVGVAPKVSIMALKYYDPKSKSNYDPMLTSVKAIRYAIAKGANVINYSGGGRGYSQEEYKALREAEAKGILVIAAAGNEDSNTDDVPFYPSSYRLTNIISVASTNKKNNLMEYSNYGTSTVDIAAPGSEIYSTLPDNKYGYLSGTSQATAFVTGAVALLLSTDSSLNFKQIKERILKSVRPLKSLEGKTRTAGILDVANVLTGSLPDINNSEISGPQLAQNRR